VAYPAWTFIEEEADFRRKEDSKLRRRIATLEAQVAELREAAGLPPVAPAEDDSQDAE